MLSAQVASIKTGTITVRKPEKAPYVKVDFLLTLANVKKVDVIVENWMFPGNTVRDWMPVYDSSVYPESFGRVYPKKMLRLSHYFSENIRYRFSEADSAVQDTFFVWMWVDKKGKILYARGDTSLVIPKMLKEDLVYATENLRNMEYGQGGGYNTPKAFLKRSEFVPESYCCELHVVVSGKPLTIEQRKTGAAFAPFDFPLNSPPSDDQHRIFIENNKSLTRK
jgi:hypothetical protein